MYLHEIRIHFAKVAQELSCSYFQPLKFPTFYNNGTNNQVDEWSHPKLVRMLVYSRIFTVIKYLQCMVCTLRDIRLTLKGGETKFTQVDVAPQNN